MRSLLPLVALTAMIGGGIGCGGKPSPLLGKWHGSYEVLRLDSVPKGTPKDVKAWSPAADLQIYVRRFELRLDGPQQGIVVKGTWKAERRGLTLQPKEVKIDDQGGEDRRDPNRPYLDNTGVREAFSRDLPLNLGSDGRRLTGVDDRLANVVGRLVVEKD